MQTLTNRRTLAVLIATVLVLSGAAVFVPVSAQEPTPPRVGGVFTITSINGDARIRDPTTNTTTTLNATLQLSAVISAVGERGFRFNITGGEITIGDEAYTVTVGAGYAIKRGGFILLHGEGLNQDDELIEFGYRGLIFPRGDGVHALLFGGLTEGGQKIGLRFWVQISRTN